MTDLQPLCALGQPAPQTRRIGTLALSEEVGLALASLALRRGTAMPDLGLPLPGPGRWVAGTGLAAFWAGPDQWMIEGPGQADTDFAARIARPGCSVIEQTDGFAAFEIAGPADRLVPLLEKLVNVDSARFAPGSATRTGFHHLSVFVIRRAPDRLALLGPRSAAGTLWHALVRAAERQEVAA